MFYRRLDRQGQAVRLLRPEDGLGDWLQIVTIRHGRPDIERKKWYSSREAHQFTLDYDQVGIVPFEQMVFELEEDEVSRIFTSDLPRTIHTAEVLFGEDIPLLSLPVFRELERQVPQILGQKRLPKAFWSLLYRGPYFLGKNYQKIEPFRKARKRIKKAAGLLDKQAQRDGAAVLVAHGLFNFFLAYALKKKGWARVRTSGKGYLGVAIFVKKS